jgi:hypothetical protein
MAVNAENKRPRDLGLIERKPMNKQENSMKNGTMLWLATLTLFSGSAFANPPELTGQCRNAVYARAAEMFINAILPVGDGERISLDGIKGVEGTERTYMVSLSESDGNSSERVKVALTKVFTPTSDDASCKIKWAKLDVDQSAN